MSGTMLHREHRCEPPYDATRKSRWRCDECGRVWRCIEDPVRWSVSRDIAFAARWNRGWWDLLTSVDGTS